MSNEQAQIDPQAVINRLSNRLYNTEMELIRAEAQLETTDGLIGQYQAEVQRLSDLLREKEHADHQPEETVKVVEGDVE